MIDNQLDIALKHVGKHTAETEKYKSAFEEMCHYYDSLMQGDTHNIENATKLMKEFGIVDENGERIYNEDDE